MKKVLYISDVGIRFIEESSGLRCTVKVQSPGKSRYYTLRTYSFKKASLPLQSQYLSWANLDCCGGWKYSESYLETAVQDGKKLYAGLTIALNDEMTESKVNDVLTCLQNRLPPDVILGNEFRSVTGWYHYFICRTGRLIDYFDLSKVFESYHHLEVPLNVEVQKKIRDYCSIPIAQYGTDPPFLYYNLDTIAQLVTTGLLLGYPLESTAALCQETICETAGTTAERRIL